MSKKKNTYISPEMEVVRLAAEQQVLAASVQGQFEDMTPTEGDWSNATLESFLGTSSLL